MEYFTIQNKVIACTSDVGSNLKMCQDALEGKATNTAIYRTKKTMFRKDFFAHVLQSVWKAAVLDCKYKDDEGTIVT